MVFYYLKRSCGYDIFSQYIGTMHKNDEIFRESTGHKNDLALNDVSLDSFQISTELKPQRTVFSV